jgi:hypothetical protein
MQQINDKRKEVDQNDQIFNPNDSGLHANMQTKFTAKWAFHAFFQ